ncbi:hypothetical protein ACV0BM_004740 [Elizabethkingia meningoseptica]|uniref:hypothetical protein n=1 Tax=Elizabethkingia meningoseptica TaxID=238 RepID=UPI00099ADAA1|nr:hypothetical protein [Elizabethkingia meningoseptica]MDE5492931.1 hypothetical protein [Elizabethkingia meningoseptica]MEC4712167.1 hypothetical protein [Elizabethkingia meningoseptica]OPB96995.1 hypothetical protein BAS10_08105 [Elizabethkingia meningoseptica]
MKKFWFILLFLWNIAYSQKAPDDQSAIQHIFNKELKAWSASIPGFSVKNFSTAQNFQFEHRSQEDFSVKEFSQFIQHYKDLLTFSPDKKHFIDLYSSSIYYDKQKKKYFSAYDIDSQVELGDISNHKNSVIYFMGSSAWVEEAAWIDNSHFILAGITVNEESLRIPYLLLGDIKTKTFQRYDCNGKSCVQTVEYRAARMGKIKIEDE